MSPWYHRQFPHNASFDTKFSWFPLTHKPDTGHRAVSTQSQWYSHGRPWLIKSFCSQSCHSLVFACPRLYRKDKKGLTRSWEFHFAFCTSTNKYWVYQELHILMHKTEYHIQVCFKMCWWQAQTFIFLSSSWKTSFIHLLSFIYDLKYLW